MGDLSLRYACAMVMTIVSVACFAPQAEAGLVSGIRDVIAGVLEVPLSTLAGTVSGPPLIGTLFGAVSGVIHGVGLVTRGTLDLAVSGLSLAKAAAPYVLPFLL